MEIMRKDLLTFFVILCTSLGSNILFRLASEKRKSHLKLDSNFYYLLGFMVIVFGSTIVALIRTI